MTQWHLNPIASGYLLALVAVALTVVSLVPTFKPMLPTRRAALVALRLAVVLLAVVLMLRPTRVSTTTRPVSALIVLLFDQSRSMTVPDMPDGKTRWNAQREMLDEAVEVLGEMPDNIETRIYGFDAAAEPMELTAGALVLPTVPEGETTDYGTALDDVLRQQRGKRFAAVIVSGDGAQRAYAPRVEMQQAAREVRRLGAPLYTVALGKDIEQSQARDVAVENLRDHYSVFVKNELYIQAALRVRGFLNQPINLQLVIEDPDGQQQVLGPVEYVAKEQGKPIDLQFSYTPQKTGQYRLTLRAGQQPGELVTKNNEMTAFLTARHGGLKVFYLDELGWPELPAIKRAISTAGDIQVDWDVVDETNRDRWPRDFAEQFGDPEYDVFIMGNVPAPALTPESIEALREAVDDGKGLLLLGGIYSYGPGRWADTPLSETLPVIIDAKEAQDFGDAPLRDDRHWLRKLKMLPARGHYITTLADDPSNNRATWEALPKLVNANRFDRLHPQAMVLAQSEDGLPLLAARNYGAGRVLAFAGDTTNRWRRWGFEEAHNRFWRQAILWLAKKEEERRDEVWIDIAQRRFNPGGRVEFTAGVKRSDGGTVSGAAVTANVTLPDGTATPARLVPEGGRFLGLFKETTQPGDYTIEVKADNVTRPARTNFLVLDEDLELSNPSANPDALDAMAEITSEFDGRRVAREEVIEILRDIKNSPPQLQEEIQQRFELGRAWWSAWLFFLLIVGLLSGEWYLRKRWGLV